MQEDVSISDSLSANLIRRANHSTLLPGTADVDYALLTNLKGSSPPYDLLEPPCSKNNPPPSMFSRAPEILLGWMRKLAFMWAFLVQSTDPDSCNWIPKSDSKPQASGRENQICTVNLFGCQRRCLEKTRQFPQASDCA